MKVLKLREASLFWPLALFTAVLTFNLLLTPEFFSIEVRDGRLYGSLVDIVNRAAPVLLLALGMTLVIATRGVDLSVGAIMAISGAVAASLLAKPAGSPLSWVEASTIPAIIALAALVALLCGLFNGALVAFVGIQPIVATLLLMVAGRGVAQLLTDGQIITFESPRFQAVGTGSFLAIPAPVWIALAVAAILVIVTRATALGLFVAATGSNPQASYLSGVNSRGIKLFVYSVSGICAGVAGLIVAADIKAADANNAGLYLELDAILAVAIGGTSLAGGRFSFAGSIVGALLMQALTTTILTRGVAFESTLVLKALLVIAVCLLQSESFRERIRVRRRAEA